MLLKFQGYIKCVVYINFVQNFLLAEYSFYIVDGLRVVLQHYCGDSFSRRVDHFDHFCSTVEESFG